MVGLLLYACQVNHVEYKLGEYSKKNSITCPIISKVQRKKLQKVRSSRDQKRYRKELSYSMNFHQPQPQTTFGYKRIYDRTVALYTLPPTKNIQYIPTFPNQDTTPRGTMHHMKLEIIKPGLYYVAISCYRTEEKSSIHRQNGRRK